MSRAGRLKMSGIERDLILQISVNLAALFVMYAGLDKKIAVIRTELNYIKRQLNLPHSGTGGL